MKEHFQRSCAIKALRRRITCVGKGRTPEHSDVTPALRQELPNAFAFKTSDQAADSMQRNPALILKLCRNMPISIGTHQFAVQHNAVGVVI
jgi:hypothetical protein